MSTKISLFCFCNSKMIFRILILQDDLVSLSFSRFFLDTEHTKDEIDHLNAIKKIAINYLVFFK